MVNGRNGRVVRKRFRGPALRTNRTIRRSLPPNLPNGQSGRMVRLSEGERRLVQRRRAQSRGIRQVAVGRKSLIRTRI